MAKESLEKAKQVDKSQGGPGNAQATRPTVPRRVQSKAVLGEQEPNETTGEGSATVKRSESSATLEYDRDKTLAEPVKVEAGKATAVKAKAAPVKTEKTENTRAAKAVHECLARSSTAEIEAATKAQKPNPKEPSSMEVAEEPSKAQKTTRANEPKPKEPSSMEVAKDSDDNKGSKDNDDNENKQENQDQGDEESSSSEDSEEQRAKEEQIKAKNAARARYMRFHRSLYSILVETRQFLIWDKEGTEDTVDETATTLFEAAENPDRYGDTTRRGRKRERSKSKSQVKKESKTKKKKSGKVKKKKKDKDVRGKSKNKKPGKSKRGDKEKDKQKSEKEKEKEREKAEKEKEKEREKAEKEKEKEREKAEKEEQKAAKKEAEEKKKKEEKVENYQDMVDSVELALKKASSIKLVMRRIRDQAAEPWPRRFLGGRLVWSFNAAFEGTNPTVGEGGRALVGNDLLRSGSPITSSNHRFALCELRGDWEYHRDLFRFTASWQGIDMCFKCPAKSKGAPEYLYHNLGPDCAWVHEEFNLVQFVSRRLKDRHLSILIVFSELLMVLVQESPQVVFFEAMNVRE
eukprot:s757_g18.t1